MPNREIKMNRKIVAKELQRVARQLDSVLRRKRKQPKQREFAFIANKDDIIDKLIYYYFGEDIVGDIDKEDGARIVADEVGWGVSRERYGRDVYVTKQVSVSYPDWDEVFKEVSKETGISVERIEGYFTEEQCSFMMN